MKHFKSPVIPQQWLFLAALACALILGLVYGSKSVLADVAPPKAPPGSNPEVDTVPTNVRMLDEKVIIDVQEETDIKEMGTARVWAEFHMKDLGTTSERLMVRFPISYSDGFGGHPEIEDMYVYVDNAVVQTSKVNLGGEPENWDDPIKWVEFEVNFPPNVMVEIEVDYTLTGTGEYPFVSYEYLLMTGAGWQGTIGKAEIIVRLPYPATAQTVFIDSSPGWGMTTTGAHLSGNEVSWYFEDFEPTYENNISIALVWPSAWYAVEQEQKRVWDFPDDGEAWGRLGKLYKELSRDRRETRYDAGGPQLFNLSLDAYLKALELLPDDALWHVAYADLLLRDSFFSFKYSGFSDARDEYLEGIKHIWIAYTLDPGIFEKVPDLVFPKEEIERVGVGYVFHWLTQTPTLIPQAVETEEPAPTQAVLYTATPQPTEEPAQILEPTQVPAAEAEPAEEEGGRISLPICGSAILFPLAFGLLAVVSGAYRKDK